MKRITASVTALLTFLMAILGMFEVKDTNEFNNKSWMAQIADTVSLGDISIPGTHDTCALYEPIHPSAKTQNYTIKDQLDMGVRFLDIRGTAVGNKIYCVHGFIYEAQTLDHVLDTCYTFLKEHPTETILFCLKEDAGLSVERFAQVFEKMVAQNPAMWYTENRLPSLGEVRGKLVLMNRYDNSWGIQTVGKWLDDQTSVIQDLQHILNVQDAYHVSDVALKWQAAEALFEKCLTKTGEAPQFFLNFLSGYMGKIPDPVTVATGMNARFMEFMGIAQPGCYGTVLFDFVTPEYCDILIQTNFK